METKISLTRQTSLIEDVDMLGFRITNMTRSGGDSSTLVSLEEMTNIISSLQQQINTNTNSIQLIDTTDGAFVGAIPLSDKGSVNGVATLDADHKIPSTQLPYLSIRDVFVVNNEMDKLSLIAQKGDIALVESTKQSYILAENLPSSNDSWVKFHTLADIYPIQQVQGKTGDVVLTAQDIGAVPSAHPINHFFYNPVFENIVSLDSNVVEYHDVLSIPTLSTISLSSVSLNTPKYVEFTTPEIISRYTILPNSPTTAFPVYWKLVGSDDDFLTSDILDERRLVLENWSSSSKTFDVTIPRSFSKYRFVFFVGGTGASTSSNISISNINMESNLSSVSVVNSSDVNNAGFYEWKTKRLTNTTDLQKVPGQIVLGTENVFQNGQLLDYNEEYSFVVGVNTTVSDILPTFSESDVSYISDKSKLTANEVSLIVENFPQFIGTSSTFNGTSIQSSGQQLDYQTYRIIDKTTSTYWDSLPVFTGTGFTGSAWVMVSFTAPKYLGWYSITPSSTSSYSPASWVLEASNDASVWNQLDVKTDIPAFTTKQDFEIPEHAEFYKYYRITFTKGFDSFIRIVELDFFNKLFGEITRSSVELSADTTRWFQNRIGYGYDVTDVVNNAGLASGYWRALFGWDNGASRTVDMYTFSQWSNTSVHAPKSWDMYGSDTGPTPHIESATSNYMSAGYDMSYFSQVVYPNNTVEVFENVFSETEFNTLNQIPKTFARTDGLTTTTSIIDSRFAVDTQDFVISCYVTWDQMILTGGYNRGILSSVESGGGNGIGFSLFSDKICFWVGYGSVNTTVYSNIVPELGKVYQLTGIRRSGTLYFYIDGNLVGSGVADYSVDRTKMVLYRDYANYDGFSGASKMKLYGLYFKQETRFVDNPFSVTYASTLAQIISASTESSTSYAAYKGISPLNTEHWRSASVGLTDIRTGSQYLSMETVGEQTVRGYKIRCSVVSSTPTAWNLLSSDDGVVWNIIDSRSNELDWYVEEERFYKIQDSNVAARRFYRIQILDVVGDTYISLKLFLDTSDWKLLDSVRNQAIWSVNEVRYFTPDVKIPCRWFMFNILDSDKLGSYMLIKNIDLLKKSDVFDSIVPPVPSKLVTIGSANFSSLYNVFDSNQTNYWVGSYPSGETHLPLYINLDGSSVLNLLEVKTPSTYRPTNILVFGSNDGYEYNLIGGQTLSYNLGYIDDEVLIDMSSNVTHYSRYLLKFFGDPTDIRISRIVMKSVATGSESGMKILTEVHPNDKIIMKYIGKS